jgi:hypothetical protein
VNGSERELSQQPDGVAPAAARPRSRLAALLEQPRGQAFETLAGPTPEVSARIAPAKADACEDVTPGASQADAALEDFIPLVPIPAPLTPTPPSWAPRRVAPETEPAAPAETSTAGAAASAPDPARPDALDAEPATLSAAPLATPAHALLAIVPASEPTPRRVRGERIASQSRRQAGTAALDHLLRSPTSVDSAADDFFEGLVRRVEGDR